MISICIPIYNRKVSSLVLELYRQAASLDIVFEIILVDNGSQYYKEENRRLSDLEYVLYSEQDSNVGRSAIRNYLAKQAAYPYLIYIDNDALVCTSDFIEKYLRVRQSGLICYGGTIYTKKIFKQDFQLRWLFGVKREAISYDKRISDPNKYFSTFNFMIDKRLVLLYPFDESLVEYGYEDILFKARLVNEGYSIEQLDNPLIHDGLIVTSDFIQRTERSLENLSFLYQERSVLKTDLLSSIRLLTVYEGLIKYSLIKIVARAFLCSKKMLLKNLKGKNPKLLFYDLYKIGYLCYLNKGNLKC